MKVWLRAAVAPFEFAIAVLIVVQAVTTLAGRGPVNPIDALLPGWLAITFSIAYLLSGLAIVVGLAWPHGSIEAGGLVLLAFLLVARGLMFGALLGWGFNAVQSLAFSLVLVAACALRLRVLLGSGP